jgi:hypothetical protein
MVRFLYYVKQDPRFKSRESLMLLTVSYTLAQVDVDDLSPEVVRAFLDLPDGGVTEVGPYNDVSNTGI